MEASFGGGFKKVRAEHGVTSFGVQVLEFPPDVTQYPEHDHAESGQEEVFGVMRGRGRITIGDEEVELEEGVFVRLGPAERRKIYWGRRACASSPLAASPGSRTRSRPLPSCPGLPSATARPDSSDG